MKKTILLVEDDAAIASALVSFFNENFYDVSWAKTLREADALLNHGTQTIVLDWLLPDGEGLAWLRKLRDLRNAVPVIFLTARSELYDKVLGLEMGANDYLTKPFEPRELLARIKVQERLASGATNASPVGEIFQHHNLEMDCEKMEVLYHKKPLSLTAMEFKLLKLFMQNPKKVFSREALLNSVWGLKYPTTRTVDVHVLQLRQKTKPELFETLHGVGYRYLPDEERVKL